MKEDDKWFLNFEFQFRLAWNAHVRWLFGLPGNYTKHHLLENIKATNRYREIISCQRYFFKLSLSSDAHTGKKLQAWREGGSDIIHQRYRPVPPPLLTLSLKSFEKDHTARDKRINVVYWFYRLWKTVNSIPSDVTLNRARALQLVISIPFFFSIN